MAQAVADRIKAERANRHDAASPSDSTPADTGSHATRARTGSPTAAAISPAGYGWPSPTTTHPSESVPPACSERSSTSRRPAARAAALARSDDRSTSSTRSARARSAAASWAVPTRPRSTRTSTPANSPSGSANTAASDGHTPASDRACAGSLTPVRSSLVAYPDRQGEQQPARVPRRCSRPRPSGSRARGPRRPCPHPRPARVDRVRPGATPTPAPARSS